jgi:5-methyltetrahydropteroyltriglutamate--homocysteine methyltransferase
VGSLLRPDELRTAVERFYAPGHSAVLDEERARDRASLTALEDRCIRDAVDRQIDCGLDVVSDGEFRRWMFLNSFYDAVQGFRTDNVVTFRNDQGESVELAVHEIVDRLRPVDSPAAREAAFMASITRHPFKVSFPAASIFGHPFTFKRGVTDRGYADLEQFVAHAIEIERTLVADAIAAGAGYIQFDFPLYPYLVDPVWIERFRERGHDPNALLEAALAADAAVVAGIPEHVTTALHICRGNFRSSWMCEGSLESVAEAVFAGLPYDTFLVEWDDLGRDGGFEPIRFLRPGSVVAMGLISSKVRRLESEDDLLRQMDHAATIAGSVDRLAISPQCGFASVMVGNDIDPGMQWRKLELVGRVADRVWSR